MKFTYKFVHSLGQRSGQHISVTKLAAFVLLASALWLHAGATLGLAGEMPPLDKDMSLAQGIELANKSFPDIQPLTEQEVIAAVKALKLMHPEVRQDVYDTYMRIVKEGVLPKGMCFKHITNWNTGNGQLKVDWLDLYLQGHVATAEETKSLPPRKYPPGFRPSGQNLVGGFVYRIRARFISSGHEQSATQPKQDTKDSVTPS